MTPEETIQRGRRAKELRENPVYREVMEHLREETIKGWRGTASGSTQLRESLFFEIHGLDAIEARLAGWVDEAEFETARLEKKTKAANQAA